MSQESKLRPTDTSPIRSARRLRRAQTREEKALWKELRAGRFAGFKFRRQHPVGGHVLDFFCPAARLSIELDGFHHGAPSQRSMDEERRAHLEQLGIEELRFWNGEWRRNKEGVLLAIWTALHRRTGCISIERKTGNHRYRPPDPTALTSPTSVPPPPPQRRSE